jgi:fermentation-respiration switch protein FrsA (DUF1100 family)
MKRFKRMLISILTILFLAFAGFTALLFLTQEKLIFHPGRTVDFTPAAFGLKHKDLNFLSADGTRLSGWLIPAPDPRGALLFCHGNAGDIADVIDAAAVFQSLGLTVLLFDYRGYGNSGGKISEKGLYADAGAAWKVLTEEEKIPPEKIIVAGRSLGGAVAAHLAMTRKPAALILESAFSSIPDMGAEIYPFLPVRLLCRIKLPTADYVANVKVPTLIIHSPDDEIVPYKQSQTLLARSAATVKHFLKLSGPHNECYYINEKTYKKGLSDFLDLALPKTQAAEPATAAAL